jgi:hypothetical protein
MRGFAAVVSSVCLCLMFVPGSRVLDAQGPGADEGNQPGPLSVHVVAGATLAHADESAGDLQSVSIGYSPTPKLTVLVGGWRMHRPTSMRRYSDGVESFTRGGTAQFVSGEVRFLFRTDDHVAPYAFTGGGFGVSRPNVNDIFTNPVTNAAYVAFGGGGLSIPLGPRLRASADLGFFMLGEQDVMRLILPVRAGLAWRF